MTGGAATGAVRGVELTGEPFYTRAQRLTNSQWDHAVTDILRLQTPSVLARDFPTPLRGITVFSNNELVLEVDQLMVDEYELAAEKVAANVAGSPQALAAAYAGTDREGFVRTLGRRAFRRPLTRAEEQKYQQLFGVAEDIYGEGFEFGAALVIRAMLQSPHFLYRTEFGEAEQPLTGYELAAKLSLWLLDTTPSDTLLDEAAALETPEGLDRAAREMLEQPAAVEVMRDFHSQLYHLYRYGSIGKVGVSEYTTELNPELEHTSLLFFDRVYQQGLGIREILTSQAGFVSPRMATLYGVDAPGSDFELRDLGAARSGYFTQLPFLMLHSINRDPDPIHRGLAVHERVLCGKLGPPTPDLPQIPPLAPGQTNRERITTLTAGCGGDCHGKLIDPLGFAFENFDGMGQLRSEDNGKPVDTQASYPFAEGERLFANASELMRILADSQQSHLCYSKQLAEYGLGRDVVADDLGTLDVLSKVSLQQASLKELALALVKDPAFRLRKGGTL